MGTTHLGTPRGPGVPWWVVPPSGHPLGAAQVHCVPSGPKKISKKFCYVWTPFDRDILRVKNKQKTATGTGYWVNRLVPKNDIKLL